MPGTVPTGFSNFEFCYKCFTDEDTSGESYKVIISQDNISNTDCTNKLVSATSQLPDPLPTLGYDASSLTISNGWSD